MLGPADDIYRMLHGNMPHQLAPGGSAPPAPIGQMVGPPMPGLPGYGPAVPGGDAPGPIDSPHTWPGGSPSMGYPGGWRARDLEDGISFGAVAPVPGQTRRVAGGPGGLAAGGDELGLLAQSGVALKEQLDPRIPRVRPAGAPQDHLAGTLTTSFDSEKSYRLRWNEGLPPKELLEMPYETWPEPLQEYNRGRPPSFPSLEGVEPVRGIYLVQIYLWLKVLLGNRRMLSGLWSTWIGSFAFWHFGLLFHRLRAAQKLLEEAHRARVFDVDAARGSVIQLSVKAWLFLTSNIVEDFLQTWLRADPGGGDAALLARVRRAAWAFRAVVVCTWSWSEAIQSLTSGDGTFLSFVNRAKTAEEEVRRKYEESVPREY